MKQERRNQHLNFMKNTILILCILAANSTYASTLSKLPTPMEQGGMIHVNVTFTDAPSGTFQVTPDAGTPTLQPISLWSPGDDFLPADPWYSSLSLTEQGLPFNSQYGFLIDSTGSDLVPSGTSLGIRLLSATPGLVAHYYRATDPKAFTPIFGPSHDYVLWNGNMWHPVFTALTAGNYSATFELFLADTEGSGVADFTTTALPQPGYSTAQVTLNFTAVPEPATSALLILGLGMLLWRFRRL